MPKLRWLSKEGDSEIVMENRATRKLAKKKFDELSKEGYRAFSKATGDKKLTPIKKFTKKADEIIMMPRIAGG